MNVLVPYRPFRHLPVAVVWLYLVPLPVRRLTKSLPERRVRQRAEPVVVVSVVHRVRRRVRFRLPDAVAFRDPREVVVPRVVRRQVPPLPVLRLLVRRRPRELAGVLPHEFLRLVAVCPVHLVARLDPCHPV